MKFGSEKKPNQPQLDSKEQSRGESMYSYCGFSFFAVRGYFNSRTDQNGEYSEHIFKEETSEYTVAQTSEYIFECNQGKHVFYPKMRMCRKLTSKCVTNLIEVRY